ncbi:hypothetical protein A2716_01875 [candidate division WWE3 bacterium RIFCSPHIGHO2_01_FULL_40_23]|uniref:Sodium/calcium exchanger membrane region domain-containing protein n=1 Tax=candidate division WWE3 bacterium RIFCSPLOWO2_01_FULL_41_18 TaxID=1802625 RepID=A0A1F4VFN5_UNCKA|nr:MAG: hypothetical protein A2716_01875 [candidate division WWE3 bacterium RIFCSPHIGHO2_01_FULL_40_23]OGC55738.1 MAG: hypothetical protein A3A78_01725 [candidate division WWE3 bacterium RIFCSPLOWO2_01_FULL_41_18]
MSSAILLYSLGITASCFLLVKSAEWMISSSSKLARHFHISEYTISFLIVSVATSLPELTVGVVSALDKNPALSFGNVLGSNIADLTIILAIPILLGGALSTKEVLKNKDLIFTVFFSILPLVLIYDGFISRVDSLVLLSGYVLYIFLVLRRSSTFESILEAFTRVNPYKELLVFIVSSLLLLLSGDLLVKSAEGISASMGVPLILIGLTVTALGTSLPELAFGLKAIKTNHKGEVVGNIIGSVVANSTLVLGVTGLIAPIPKNGAIGGSSIIFLLVVLLLFFISSVTGRKISKWEAGSLIVIYALFILTEKLLSGV